MSPEREIRTLKLQTANAVDEVVMLGGLVGLATQLSEIGTKNETCSENYFSNVVVSSEIGKS